MSNDPDVTHASVKNHVFAVQRGTPRHLELGHAMSWQTAKERCEEMGMRLCYARELFDREFKFIFGATRVMGDHWTPVLDGENEWVQIGASDGSTSFDPIAKVARESKWKALLIEPDPVSYAELTSEENLQSMPNDYQYEQARTRARPTAQRRRL